MGREAGRWWGRGRCAGDEHGSWSGLEREEWGEREARGRARVGGEGGGGRVSPSIRFTGVKRETVRRGRPVCGPVLGFAAPWAVARHCRAKMCSAAAPVTSASMAHGSAMSSQLPRRHT